MQKIIDHIKAEWYKYVLEILVITIGILGAFALNNWNENRKEKQKITELVNLQITDIKGKVKENSTDYSLGLRIVHKTDTLIRVWEKTNSIDTTYLKDAINFFGADYGYTSRSSPIYDGLSNSDLWKQIPDTLTRKADVYYRETLEAVQVSFQRFTEYSYENKISFLTPNNLLDYDERTHPELIQLLEGKEEQFIRKIKLTRNGMATLVSRWKDAIDSGNELILSLENYNKK